MRKLSRGLLLVGLALFPLLYVVPTASAQPKLYPPLFGSVESPREGLKPFPRWTGVLERHAKQQELFEKTFGTFIKSARALGPTGQLEAVQRYVNSAMQYDIDPVLYGVRDYWATPYESFIKRKGDCEDYAIAKFMLLRALGWSPEDLRIVVLRDLNRKIAHAVLVVYQNKEALILDNQILMVVAQKNIRHYRPIYSINEKGWWRHRSAKPTPQSIVPN